MNVWVVVYLFQSIVEQVKAFGEESKARQLIKDQIATWTDDERQYCKDVIKADVKTSTYFADDEEDEKEILLEECEVQ